MSNVEFDESGSEYQSGRNFAAEQISGIARMLIKIGIAKDESQAKIVMVIIVVLCLGTSAFIIFSGRQKPTPAVDIAKYFPSQPQTN